MRVLAVVLLATFCFTATFAKIETEDGVLVITKDNFDTALKEHEYILFEFYAPWCGHCKALAPEYAKAAEKLAEMKSEIKLAKVDAIVETTLAEKHGVRGYPTLKFYRKGNAVSYTGGRRAEDIVNWLLKKTGSPAKNLTTVEEAKSFVDAHNVVIIGFFKNIESDAAKAFLEAAAVDDNEYVFGISDNEDVFKEYEIEDGKVVLFKKIDEGKSVFEGELTAENLKTFIAIQSLPLVVDFNQDTAQKIFNGVIKNHFLVFLSKEAKHYEKYVEELKEPAKKFRDEVLFVTINADETDHQRVMEFFGMKKDDIPAMSIVKLQQDMAKYKPEKPELTAENVVDFVTAFLEGKVEQHYLTQELPADWDKHPVKVLVGTNFREVAFDKTKNVLVEFYAPWCGHCQQLAPIYEKLGEKYKDNESLVIAKMDATANELKDLKVEMFPTIILYKKGTNEAVEYNGVRTFEGLSKFIDSDGTYDQAADETQEEDEDDDVPRKDEL